MPAPGGPLSLGPVSPNTGSSGGSEPQRGGVSGGGVGPLARHVKRKLAGLLDGWRRVKSFRLFLEPVDVEQMECPTYYDVIKNPMDLRTMEAKLERDEYRSEEAFIADLLLIFRNCRTFNDEATPAGQYVLRLCAEAEARSLEDLKKACKDSKLWAALEQQFSHGKQKTAVRQKGGGASKRAAPGGSSAPESAVPAGAAAAAASAAAGGAAPALGRPGAAEHHPPSLSYDGAGKDAMGASPEGACMNGLVYTGMTAAGEEAAAAAGVAGSVGEAAAFDKVEDGTAAGDNTSETTLQQASTSGAAAVASPSSNPLTPATSGSHRSLLQTNWQAEGGAHGGQGIQDMENCLTGKSWYIYCRDNILRPLKGDRYAYLFLTPVLDSPELPDAVKTSYKSVIARPMDYGTIWTKLTARDYHHPQEFFEDMFLVYSNCMAFNPPNDQQCGWLHRVAEKSRDKFVERWRRWVVRIWRAFAQHNAAAAAAPPPVLQHAEAAKTAAAVESEPAIAAGLAAARAELLERRHSHAALPFPAPSQQLQQQAELAPAPLQHPQLQHPPVQMHPRGREEPQDTVASAAAAAKDPKYRALVVDLLGEDALEDASNSSLDRGATTQEILQQQLQQLQEQQQLLQHEHLQLQQQQLEMQEKEQALARASAAGEGPALSDNTTGIGAPGSTGLHQPEQQQQQRQPQVSDPVSEHPAAVASPGAVAAAAAGSDASLEQQQQHEDATATAAGDVVASAPSEGRRNKTKKQKYHKHVQRNQQQTLQQEAHNAQLLQEASATFQQPGVLQPLHQADSAAAQGYYAATGTENATASAGPAAISSAVLAAAPIGHPCADPPAVPPGPGVLSTDLTDTHAFPAAVSPQHGAAAAPGAATTAGDTAASSLLHVPSLGDSPRLCDIIEAPPAEILKAMGVKDVDALPAAGAPAASPASFPESAAPAAVPLAGVDASLAGVPPAPDPAAAVSTTWLAGATPSQVSAVPVVAGVTEAPPAAAPAGMRGHPGVDPPSLAPPVDGMVGTPQMQRSAGFHDVQQQHQALQQLPAREELLPAKLRIVLESTRRRGPPPRILLLPWRGRGTGPIPEGCGRPRLRTPCSSALAAAVAASGESTAAEPTATSDATDRSVKRETTQVDSVSASADGEAITEAGPPPDAAVAAATEESSSREQRPKLSLRLRCSNSISNRRLATAAAGIMGVPRSVFFAEDSDAELEEALEGMPVDSSRETNAAAAAAAESSDGVPAGATFDAAQTKAVLVAATTASTAAEAAAAQGGSTTHMLRLLCRVCQLPEGVEIHTVRAGLKQCGFFRHALSPCCSNQHSKDGGSTSNDCNGSSNGNNDYADAEMWLQQQTVRIQPMGPLTAILGDAADCCCPISVSLLRCIRLSSAAASAIAAPLLLHLKLQGADAAAAALAAKGEYLVSPHFQLAAAAATGDDKVMTSGSLTPPAAAHAAASIASTAAATGGAAGPAIPKCNSRSCCCSAGLQHGLQSRVALLAGRSVFSVERQAIRTLPGRLLEEAQQKKRRGGQANSCWFGSSWGTAPHKRLADALGRGLLQLLLRAAASASTGNALGNSSSCTSSCSKSYEGDGNTRGECLSEGLRFVEDLNLWAAALPSELLLPVQQHQQQQRQRMLRLPAVDVLLVHSEPLGLVTLSKPRACRVHGHAAAAPTACLADGLRSRQEEPPVQLKTEAPSHMVTRKRKALNDWDKGGTSGSSSNNSIGRCCCCCCFLTDVAVPPVVEPLQVALCLG